MIDAGLAWRSTPSSSRKYCLYETVTLPFRSVKTMPFMDIVFYALSRPLPLFLGPDVFAFVLNGISQIRSFIITRCSKGLQTIRTADLMIFICQLVIFKCFLIGWKKEWG